MLIWKIGGWQMEANELRIGNWVNYKDIPDKVDGIQPSWVWFDITPSDSMKHVSGITLTEEWL